ncbi:terminase small subunit [Rhodomicrobium lacus]|uniref:terminase small subunit n=1 Tax=Rhodomicrobium lacus TaxID=2498452 RepID=UPI0026E47888|nr:terminase small subunit [Rhodomicrobium lacus]WKW52030.1 terminase small subunit [Rhodomicrobium lacus]
MADRVVSTFELSDWTGVSEQHIRALARKGAIPMRVPGRFPLKAAVRATVDHLRAQRPGAASNASLAEERKRLIAEQADREALRNAETRGELVPAADVKAAWESILTDVRSRLLAVPARLPELDRATAERLDREIRDALEALANG